MCVANILCLISQDTFRGLSCQIKAVLATHGGSTQYKAGSFNVVTDQFRGASLLCASL